MSNMLEQKIRELTEFIYDLAPEVFVERKDVIYEDEHANLKIYPPLSWEDQQCFELQHAIAGQSLEILLESGYMLQAYVYTAGEQVQEAQNKLVQAHQQEEAARLLLAKAANLGLQPALSAVPTSAH